jgi:uncharacterized protein YjbJ (UPF0337 family)
MPLGVRSRRFFFAAAVGRAKSIEECMMKRLLLVLIVVAACALGLAFYRGWIGVTSDSATGVQHHVHGRKAPGGREESRRETARHRPIGEGMILNGMENAMFRWDGSEQRSEYDPQHSNRVWRLIMNWDQIAGNWKQLTGKVKEKWGKLTDDELTTIAGKRDQLTGYIQQHYGIAKEQAGKDADEFAKTLSK